MQVRLENTESQIEKGQSEATKNDEEREMDFEGRSVMKDIEGGMNDEGYMESTMIMYFHTFVVNAPLCCLSVELIAMHSKN